MNETDVTAESQAAQAVADAEMAAEEAAEQEAQTWAEAADTDDSAANPQSADDSAAW